MAVKYYSDGTYTKGDGKLYRPGIGVVGSDKSTNVSKAESGTSKNTTSNTTTSKNTTSNKTGSTISTMRGTGSSSKSYAETLKDNITNSINNPSNGVYSSLSNNSVMKDMVAAYNYSTGKNATMPNTNKTPIVQETVEEIVEEPYNPYEDKYNELKAAYDRQEELLREQNRLAVEQGVNRLESQKYNVNQSADENARQAYVQYMQSQKALPQQLASQGVSGGATETANLGLQTAYQNNVNTINQNKANRLQEIDNAIVDLQNTGDLTMVEQVLANNQAALDAYTANFDKGVSYNQWAQQFNANREDTLADQAYRDKVYADQLAQQNRENQWYEQSYKDQMAQQDRENQWYIDSYKDAKNKEEIDRVITLLGNGIYNRETASALLGVPVEQLDKFVADINKARDLELRNTQSLISNRNNGGYKPANKVDVFNDALAMLKTDGWTAEDVMKFVWGQGLSEADEMDVLSNLGLLTQGTITPEPTQTPSIERGNTVNYTPPKTLNEMLDVLNLPLAKLPSSNSTSQNSSKGIIEQSKENKEPLLRTLLKNTK